VSRGGVVSAFPGGIITPVFTGALVGPSITIGTFQNGLITVLFTGGELQEAVTAAGPWIDTGDFSGNHAEEVGTNQTRFFRVRSP